MGSVRFKPRHAHGFYADIEAIVDLRLDGTVSLANHRRHETKEWSKSDVRYVLTIAAKHFDELVALWEKHHG